MGIFISEKGYTYGNQSGRPPHANCKMLFFLMSLWAIIMFKTIGVDNLKVRYQ